jgi:hypothetical protein
MSTPCNSLNVQLIKISDLASYSSLKDTDILMTIQNDGSSTKYSRKSTLSDLKSYTLKSGFSTFPSSAFNTTTDTNNLNFYTGGNQTFTFNHGFSTVPSLIRVVLLCSTNDGLFSVNDELDLQSCYNNNENPICTIVSKSTLTKLIVPTFTSIKTYTATNPAIEVNLSLTSWYFKIYAWK